MEVGIEYLENMLLYFVSMVLKFFFVSISNFYFQKQKMQIPKSILGGILIPELGEPLQSRGIDNFDTYYQRSTRFETTNESADQLRNTKFLINL